MVKHYMKLIRIKTIYKLLFLQMFQIMVRLDRTKYHILEISQFFPCYAPLSINLYTTRQLPGDVAQWVECRTHGHNVSGHLKVCGSSPQLAN